MEYIIEKTSYPVSFGKYGDMEDRMKELGQNAAHMRLSKCIVCKQPFSRDDDVYLAKIKRGRNKFLCGNCAARI